MDKFFSGNALKEMIDNKIHELNPLIKHGASWRFDNLEDAADVIVGLFGDYVGPVLH